MVVGEGDVFVVVKLLGEVVVEELYLCCFGGGGERATIFSVSPVSLVVSLLVSDAVVGGVVFGV